jgi:acetoin utilization deacetylase AcuC-like enzyme
MKIVYDKKYEEVYTSDPAAEAGRIECIIKEIKDSYKIVKPQEANEDDLALVHSIRHINEIKRYNFYKIALLAVGGANKAAEIALTGEPTFGLIRPPGHHASQDSCWGFCFFNNIAISVEKLRIIKKEIKKALIIDFDLHYGDGTANIFSESPKVNYYSLSKAKREKQLDDLSNYLQNKRDFDLLAVSAGFDRHVQDWGGILETNDYEEIGKILKESAHKVCYGRRYALLEGGYNHKVLGKNVKAFLNGFKD